MTQKKERKLLRKEQQRIKHSNKRFVLAIDSSSSSVEACLINVSSGAIEERFSKPLTLYIPRENWYEHDAEELWTKQLEVIEEAISYASHCAVVGIGIANQRETIVAWDKDTLKPICRCISWQDARNKEFLEKYKEHRELIRDKTGLFISEYFSASKMTWILENVPYDREKIRFGTVDSWLIANLTNGVIHFTDVTNASRTLCMNLETEDWDQELLDLFGIPRSALPTIRPSGSCFGYWKEFPIWGVIGDQQATLLTMGAHEGALHCTFGTGLFVMRNNGVRRSNVDKTVTSVAWKIDGEKTVYALENGSFVCGKILDRLHNSKHFDSFEVKKYPIPLSVYVEPMGNRWLLFGRNLNRPLSFNFFPDKQRGPLILKALLNGLALTALDLITTIEQEHLPVTDILLSGNISNIDYLKQVQAIVLDKKVSSSCQGSHSALGAAFLVLLSRKIIDWEDIKQFNEKTRIFHRNSQINSIEHAGLLNLWTWLKYSV